MRSFTLSDLAARMEGSLHGDPELLIHGFATDSREAGPQDLFLCIAGSKVDGHLFWSSSGAAAALAERSVSGQHILVPSLVEALAKFGRSLRQEFSGHVVGITGSAGKTTAKEMTASALSTLGPVLKSRGNRNTEFTSPLVWTEDDGSARSAVVEMGMRGFGQIAHLGSVAQPTIGLITGIGTAHIEMVGSREGIARAKGELFEALPASGTAVLPVEDDFAAYLRSVARCPVVTFGFAPEADVRVIGCRALSWDRSLVRLAGDGWEAEVQLPTLGRHQAGNAAGAVAAAIAAGCDPVQATIALAGVQMPPMRMEARQWRGATLLLDNYNANPDATVAALRAISEAPCTGRRLAVLGEMRELGDFTERGHQLVGEALAESAVDLALLTGGPTQFAAESALGRGMPAARIQSEPALDLNHVRNFLLDQVKPGDLVLIKGSRALELEKAIPGEEGD